MPTPACPNHRFQDHPLGYYVCERCGFVPSFDQAEALGLDGTMRITPTDLLVAARLRTAANLPGVRYAIVWPDGVEFCGSPNDQDDQAAFLPGRFDHVQVRRLLHPLPVHMDTMATA